eukprot:m.32853 g.32853  ORF g.32853 m.32853 type:complete len:88 (+) comp7111_c0_seq1:64-327(+)
MNSVRHPVTHSINHPIPNPTPTLCSHRHTYLRSDPSLCTTGPHIDTALPTASAPTPLQLNSTKQWHHPTAPRQLPHPPFGSAAQESS